MKNGNRKLELYNLEKDISEQHDLAGQHPELIQKIEKTMQSARIPSEFEKWNFMDPEVKKE